MKFKTVDVSGMGGGYEHTCQKMIKAGMDWMLANGALTEEEFKDEANVRTKELEKFIVKASDDDCTGAMYYTAKNHSYMRISKGDEWYFAQFIDDPGRVYFWDGTKESCPVADSKHNSTRPLCADALVRFVHLLDICSKHYAFEDRQWERETLAKAWIEEKK